MPQKKKATEEEVMEQSNGSDSDSSDDDCDDDVEFDERNEEIQVEFEGRNPIDSDFHGIRQLLSQLFLKSDVNVSELADYIIGQNYIGSVVTQCEDDEDEDEDDEMTDGNMVFGITTAVNLNKTDVPCIGQLRNLVDVKAKANAPADAYSQLKSILEGYTTGFLFNERYVNIPPQIAVPLMESLVKEIDRAKMKKMPFQFSHYVMMLKFYRIAQKKSKSSSETFECVYSNAEEEAFVKNTMLEFEYTAQREDESVEAKDDLVPYRKIIVFEAEKLPHIIESIKKLID